MVISISPSARSSKFNNLATLKIEHSAGIVESPNRLVNRHDLNAKDAIGANIPLTRSSKTFIYQDIVDDEKLDSVLHKNGYLDEILQKANSFATRIGRSESLFLLYPSLTKSVASSMNERAKHQYMQFYCALAQIMRLDAIILPYITDISDILSITKRHDLQLIPVIKLKGSTKDFSKKFHACRSVGHADIPFIGLKFATYPKADKAYNLVMGSLEPMHEKRQGTMLIDSPRYISSDNSLNVSGLHYSPFFMADLVAERYRKGGGGAGTQSVRLFCRNDLVTAPIETNLVANGKFDSAVESRVFPNDPKLQELLLATAENRLTEQDWTNNRPGYLTRAHENVQTRKEFADLQRHINNDTAKEYLNEKNDMSSVVRLHLQRRITNGSLNGFFHD
jgi:hypothetical protein